LGCGDWVEASSVWAFMTSFSVLSFLLPLFFIFNGLLGCMSWCLSMMVDWVILAVVQVLCIMIVMENNQNSRLIEKRVKRERRNKLGKEGKTGEK
jgi:hypothetical protein